jgi:plasmid stabilization system protein ParE
VGSVRKHRAAVRELAAAARWYEERAGLGAELLDEFEAALDRIMAHPRAWPSMATATDLELRRYLLPRFPYYVVYLVARDGTVHILAFAHVRRRPGYWRRRTRSVRRRGQ